MEVPLYWRLFLFVSKELITQQIQAEWERLNASLPEVHTVLIEGLFNLVKASMVFTRTGEDVAVIGFHCAPIRDGLAADSRASNAEMDLIAARLLTFWNAIDGMFVPELSYDRLVFHDAGPKVTNVAGKTLPLDAPKGSKNPALRTDVIGLPGTSDDTKVLPPQVAVSITFKTPVRRQWGRVYLPAPDDNSLKTATTHANSAGQIVNTRVVEIRNAAGDLLDGLNTDEVPLVVWSHVHQHALTVDQVQVDSLFDVIRSRRFDRAATVETHTLGA